MGGKKGIKRGGSGFNVQRSGFNVQNNDTTKKKVESRI
jgi:hypothetical protein